VFFSEPEIWFDDVDEILLDRKHLVSAGPTPSLPSSTPAASADQGEVNHVSKEGEASQAAVKNPLIKSDAYKGYGLVKLRK